MRYEKDPTHLILTDVAKQSVDDTGQFDKRQVIEKAGFGAYTDQIIDDLKWEKIRESTEVEHGEMISIATATSARHQPDLHPEKFLPGRGRPTTGYATAMVYPEVTKEYLKRQYNMAVGMMQRMERKALSFQKQGLNINYRPAGLPRLDLPPAAAE